MARWSVARPAPARQPTLPGFAGLAGSGWAGTAGAQAPPARDAKETAERAGPDWEERCYAAGCAFARELAGGLLAALEGWLHLSRPSAWRVEGFRTRVLVTRMGDLRVRRRLYRDSGGDAHFLLDEHLGWTPRQVATPSVLALLVDWAADVPFAAAATRRPGNWRRPRRGCSRSPAPPSAARCAAWPSVCGWPKRRRVRRGS